MVRASSGLNIRHSPCNNPKQLLIAEANAQYAWFSSVVMAHFSGAGSAQIDRMHLA